MYLRKRKRKIAVRRIKRFRLAFHMMAQVASHGGISYTADDIKLIFIRYVSKKVKRCSVFKF